MNDFNFKKSKHSKGNKGFYVVLGICVIAVGLAAFFTYSNVGNNTLELSESDNSSKSEAYIENDEETQEINAKVSEKGGAESKSTDQKSAQEVVATNTDATVPSQETKELYIYPSGTTITKEYSNSNPVYSITLNDWRVHDGVDFAADTGSMVKAIHSGKVKDIYEDPSLGKTIVIDHGNGIEGYYSGLGETTLVQIGEEVDTGRDIGSVKTVPCEVLEEVHLHFAVKQDGTYINPMNIIDRKE